MCFPLNERKRGIAALPRNVWPTRLTLERTGAAVGDDEGRIVDVEDW